MLITVFTFLILNQLLMEAAAVQYMPCLTSAVPFHCNSCSKGQYIAREGAYNACLRCPSECTECNSRSRCHRCITGRYGSMCQHVCSKGCIDSICDLKSGTCVCKKNYSGAKCDRCTNGKYGYELSNCELTCPAYCKACISNNTCTHCNDGYYGFTCEKLCSRGCFFGTCNQGNGTCNGNECKANFYGSHCDKCSTGWHGDDCASSCPRNCVSCLSEISCDICKEGHWGSACQNNCSHGCLDEPCTKGLMTSYFSFAINCFGRLS